jgi:competence protein ComEA
MERTFLRALSRAATRVAGSRFAKPVARVVLAAAGLVLLAFIGRSAIAGAIAGSPAPAASAPVVDTPSAESGNPPAAAAPTESPSHVSPPRFRASADDPVVVNTATEADLRRLPGIGAKRADAILALRTRLGHFRALEDLLKVKGIGRATLKRLRPLLRLDPPPLDGGPSPQPATPSSR